MAGELRRALGQDAPSLADTLLNLGYSRVQRVVYIPVAGVEGALHAEAEKREVVAVHRHGVRVHHEVCQTLHAPQVAQILIHCGGHVRVGHLHTGVFGHLALRHAHLLGQV